MSSIFGSNLAPICGQCLGRRSPMSDVAGESPTPLGLASTTSSASWRRCQAFPTWRHYSALAAFERAFSFFSFLFSLVLDCVVGCGGSCRCPNPTGQSSRRLWSRSQSDQAECRLWWLVSMSQSDRAESCGGSCRCSNPTR